jgi:large subunit ribosomal protein L17
MRHGKKINHLSRTAPHRRAMLSNMASSLIQNKRITTTVAKAKALRKYVEPLLTKSKEDTTHSRRVVFSYLNDKESVRTLFDEVAQKIAERPGGYTRILKTGNRLGDNADMCIIELVDYNELMLETKTAKKTRRSRRGGGSKSGDAAETTATKKEDKKKVTEAKAEEADASVETAEVEDVEVQAADASATDAPEATTEETTEASEEPADDKEDTEEKKEKE